MPTRHDLTSKVMTPQAQGDGSYIIALRLTWGERQRQHAEFQRMAQDVRDGKLQQADYDKALYEFIFSHITGWNWVDGNGNPLPLPKTAADMDGYLDEEVEEIMKVGARIIRGEIDYTEAEKKK